MKLFSKFAAALVAAGMLAAGPAAAQEKLTVWWVKGFYKSEDDALFAAIKKFEDKTGVKVELSQYAVQDMIPKTVAALDAGTPPDVAYADVYDLQVAGKWAFDGKLEDLSDVIAPMKDRFAPEHARDRRTSTTTRPRRRPTTPSRSSSRRCMSSTGRTCWARPASRKPTSRPTGRTTGRSGATRCSRRIAPRHRPAHLRHRPADGRGLHRLLLLVPDLHGRLQRQAGRRRRQAAGRRSQGAGRA